MLYIIENKYYSFSKPVISINPLISLYKQATNNLTFKCFISNIDHYNIIELDTDDLFIHCIEFKDTIVYFESLENAKSFSDITSTPIYTLVELIYDVSDINTFSHDYFITNLIEFSQIKFSYKFINIFKLNVVVDMVENIHVTAFSPINWYIIITDRQKFCLTIHKDKNMLHFYIDDNPVNYLTTYERKLKLNPIIFIINGHMMFNKRCALIKHHVSL